MPDTTYTMSTKPILLSRSDIHGLIMITNSPHMAHWESPSIGKSVYHMLTPFARRVADGLIACTLFTTDALRRAAKLKQYEWEVVESLLSDGRFYSWIRDLPPDDPWYGAVWSPWWGSPKS